MSGSQRGPVVADVAGLLPHRPPFLFIDEVVEQSAGRIHVVRTFRPDEDFFRGHFPGRPIVPGVLLLEMMAQAFACMTATAGKGVYLTGVDRARFRKPVLPGEVVHVFAELTDERMGIKRGKAEAKVGEGKVADAVLWGTAEA